MTENYVADKVTSRKLRKGKSIQSTPRSGGGNAVSTESVSSTFGLSEAYLIAQVQSLEIDGPFDCDENPTVRLTLTRECGGTSRVGKSTRPSRVRDRRSDYPGDHV